MSFNPQNDVRINIPSEQEYLQQQIPSNFPMQVNVPILQNSTLVTNASDVPIITSTLEPQGFTSISKTNEPQNHLKTTEGIKVVSISKQNTKIPPKPECKWNGRELVWLGAAAAIIATVIAMSNLSTFDKYKGLPTKTYINRVKLCKAGHEFLGCHNNVYYASEAPEFFPLSCTAFFEYFLDRNSPPQNFEYKDLEGHLVTCGTPYLENMSKEIFEKIKFYTYDFFEKYQARRGVLERMRDAVYDKLFL